MVQIGEFSKICRVSVKTLRYYDKLGLLRPAAVDRETGYRYYDQSQLERMLLIRKLRRYGFSLEEILSLLRGGDAGFLREALLRQRERLKCQQTELGLIIHEMTLDLQNLERTGDLMNGTGSYTVKLTESPALAILSGRRRMGVDDFGRYYGALYERLGSARATPDGVFGAIYYDEEFHSESSDIELFIGIREPDRADRVIAPRPCAMTVHRGPYSTLPEAYAALVSWIEANGFEWNDAPYDVYVKTAEDGCAPQDWETEVWFPVRKKTE